MENHYDQTDEYHIQVNKKILTFTPIIGGSAAITFTVARLLGKFSFVSLTNLICFDVACLSYFVVAYFLKKAGIVKNGVINPKAMDNADLFMVGLIIFQWNLITYIFPTRDFWGYAPMFVLLSSFMFRTKAVRDSIIGISTSIGVSWIINGDELLPVRDELFAENFILRCIALVISFAVIYVLTFYAERFTNLVKDNIQSIEKQNEELKNIGRDIIDFTADIIEERDVTSGSHVKRIKAYTRVLAEEIAKECPEYGLTEEKINLISLACVLHDVGKIAIPDSILLKPGKLTNEEFEIIKTHTSIGPRIIDKLPDSVDSDYKRYCREICQFHHEKYDGKGYPTGLKENEIPISAQIVSVVDCFDALCNDRPYKNALPADVAINMILNGECGAFSDKMKQCIINCKEKFINI